MRWKSAACLLLVIPSAAAAQSMNAQAFYQRASGLKAKGVMALFSGGEIKALMAEGQAAGKKAAEQRRADLAAGRPPRFCPPPGPQKMHSDEFMARLAAIPLDERRRIDMAEATTRIMAAKFPCRA